MPILAIILIIASIVFLIATFIWNISFTGFVAEALHANGLEWLDPGNFWFWLLTFLVLLIALGVARAVVSLVRMVVILLFGLVGIGGKTTGYLTAVTVGSIIWGLIAILASFPLTSIAMEFFAQHSEWNGWLGEGGFFATILTYLVILGILSPSSKNEKD